MGAYTSTQLIVRLLTLLLGLAGGLCQTVWSQVVGMRCGAAQIGEYVFHTDCLPWTELFLRFPQDSSTEMVSVVLAAAIAGMVAGLGGMWRARWAAVLFLLLAVWNVGLLVYAVTGMDQKPIAVILAFVSVAVPAICAVLLWWRGEYRAPRRQSAVAGDTGPWTV
ncbi:MAG: hypothetical protein OXE87_10460 [Chloroflexi bacterium]|nr:hypothetical protein [Chloroflexota bacterium]